MMGLCNSATNKMIKAWPFRKRLGFQPCTFSLKQLKCNKRKEWSWVGILFNRLLGAPFFSVSILASKWLWGFFSHLTSLFHRLNDCSWWYWPISFPCHAGRLELGCSPIPPSLCTTLPPTPHQWRASFSKFPLHVFPLTENQLRVVLLNSSMFA